MNVKKIIFYGLLPIVLLASAGCGSGQEPPKSGSAPVSLTVSAAASLRDAAEELKALYAAKQPNVKITYNFAASGPLQKQIEEGAPVDLFISAGKTQMDALAAKGLIVDASRRDLLGNDLVLIAGKDSTISGFEGLADKSVGKISIGTPDTVPAGQYAREVLTALTVWDKIQPKLVLAKDVRQVLTYVETGNVDAGLVYRSDAVNGKNIRVIAVAPAGSHRPIVYPVAIIKSTRHPKEAEEFALFLSSDEAAAVFTGHGFKPIKK